MTENSFPFYKKVLIIDDTEVDRFIARRVFKKYNFANEVICMDSAQAGLEYLQQLNETDELPQVIFLDIKMPDMDGFGFLDHYATLPERIKKHSTIMMLSTSLDPRDPERARKNPFVNKYLSKPLSREILAAI